MLCFFQVGHDAGKEFSFHWWDHMFNKAASSIQVETTEVSSTFTGGIICLTKLLAVYKWRLLRYVNMPNVKFLNIQKPKMFAVIHYANMSM